MADNFRRQTDRSRIIPTLDIAIDALNLAKEVVGTTSVNPALSTAAILLTMIRDTMNNDQDYVCLGLSCANICRTLERGLGGKQLSDLSKSMADAINRITTALDNVVQHITSLQRQCIIVRVLKDARNANKLGSLVEDIHKGVISYRTAVEQDIYDQSCQLTEGVDRILLHNVNHTTDTRRHRQGHQKGDMILLRLKSIDKDVDRLSRLIPLIDAYFTL